MIQVVATIKLKSESEISPDTTLRNRLGPTPLPRGEHASAKIGNKLYVFGGYGGLGFARRDFNDMYALDTETWSWERIEYAKIELGEDDEDDEDEEALNPEPPARAGHKWMPSVIQNLLYMVVGQIKNN